MDEDLNFEGLDEENDNIEDAVTESKKSENIKENHIKLGASAETLKVLENLLKSDKFPGAIFLEILDCFEKEKNEAKDKLYDFYCFLEKYIENLNSDNLLKIIRLKKDSKIDIFSFWSKNLKYEILNNLLHDRQKMELNDFFKHFSSELIESGYEIKNIFQLICELIKYEPEKNPENELIMESILNILKTYKIEDEFYEVIKKHIKPFNKNSPKFIYSDVSKGDKILEDLTKDELLEEIEKRNPVYFTEERKNNLIRQMDIVYEIYKSRKDLYNKEGIKNWLKNELPNLKKQYEKNENRIEISAKILAVISIANEIFTKSIKNKGYKLRDIQIMSVLLFISKNDEKGLIEEISTGEGKSTIICVLATFLALIGKKVDIVTSALNLAKRDAENLKEFYRIFDLTVDYVENSRPDPYKKNIIYGSFLEYEADFLREKTQKKRIIRGKREFEVLIVDEIDNLFIDNIDGSTRLVYSSMGYQFLAPIFVNIFFVMKTYEQQFSEYFRKMIKNKKMEDEDKNYFLNKINEENFRDENIYPILKIFLCNFMRKLYGMSKNRENDENIDGNDLLEKSDTMREFFENINKTLHLPENLKSIFDNQLEDWIDNAYKALFNFHENRDYVVSNGIIAPVDRENTGEVEQSKVYRDGLHRMLEIKHHLRIRDENLNHTFLSHISYFKKYNYEKKKKLFFYGMTGTLGDSNTIEIFKEKTKFNSEVLYIPTYKKKRFVEFPSILCKDEKEQIGIICEEIEYQCKQKRKILVINDSIEQAKNLKNHLMNKKDFNEQIGLYTRDDDKKQMETIKQDYNIILATNLAGRGTDIKTSPVNEINGGLHIILTSMPNNYRIERQAFGRTSRQGNKGSGQMIILKEKFNTLKEYKDDRDEKEKKRLNDISKIMNQTLFKDQLYDKYISLLNKYDIDVISSEDIDERWGTFLDKYIDSKEKLDNEKMNAIEKKFDEFIRELNTDLNENNYKEKIKNSFLNISYGWKNYKNSPKSQNTYNEIAIKNEKYSFAAHYYEAKNIITQSKIGKYPIEEIKNKLNETLKILELILEESVDVCYNQFNERIKEYEGSKILEQMLNRKYLVKCVISQVSKNIEVVEKYIKLKSENEKNIRDIEIICKVKDLEEIYKQKDCKEKEKYPEETQKEMEETLNFLENSGLYEIYELDLKKKYKWYQKLLFFLKTPLEFLLGLAAILFFPGIGGIVGSLIIGHSIASCFNYFLTIHSGAIFDFKDFVLNISTMSAITRRINYFIGKDIFSIFYKKKTQSRERSKAVSDNFELNKSCDFINESKKLNKIKNYSKEKIEKYIKDKFEHIIIEKQKENIKYLLCFDDYLKNNFWKNTIKNEIMEHYKNNFKKDFKNKEEEIINILKNGYEKDNYMKASNEIESILRPMIKECLESLDKSLDKFMKLKDFDKEKGLNSLEHLIINLNPEKIDNNLAKEIIKEFKKYNIINNENNESKYKFNYSIEEKPTLNFIIETDLRNIKIETQDFTKFNLLKLSIKPIINEDMDDKVEQMEKNFEQSAKELEDFKEGLLRKIIFRNIKLIIQSFSEEKIISEFLDEMKKLLLEKIICRLNKKIYSQLDTKILGDITKTSLKDAEKQVLNNIKAILFKKDKFEKSDDKK